MKLLTVLVLLAVIVTIRATTVEQLKGNVAQFIKSNGNRVVYFTGSEGTAERHYIDRAVEKWTNPNNVEVQFGNFEARKRTQELSVNAVGAKLGDLVWFNNGRKRAVFRPDEYTKVEEIVSWMTSSSVGALETVSDPETLRLLTTECSGEHSSIILFSTEANTNAELDLLYLQNDYEPLFQFRAVRDASLIDKLSVKDNTIAVYQCFENEQGQIFKRDAKELGTGLSKWVLTHAAPYVSPATKLAFTRSQACFDHTVLLVLEKEDKSLLDDVLKAAKAAKTFGFIYGYKKDARLVEKVKQVGASGTKFPTAVAQSANAQDQTIVWDENKQFNFASLSKWLEEIQTKQAVTFQKSGPVPPKTTGWIQPVVRSNFDEEVVTQSSTRPVVVFFTAPSEYCYACYGVEQDIKLAYDRANPNSVRVVSYDLHENANPLKQQVYPGDIVAFVDGTASSPYVPTQTVTKWLSNFVKFNNHDEL